MGESRRNKKLPLVFSGEEDPMPLPERRGTAAQVNRYIEYLALEGLQQFSLSVWILKMKSAQCAPTGAGQVVLDELNVQASLAVVIAIPQLHEKPSSIAEYLGLDHH